MVDPDFSPPKFLLAQIYTTHWTQRAPSADDGRPCEVSTKPSEERSVCAVLYFYFAQSVSQLRVWYIYIELSSTDITLPLSTHLSFTFCILDTNTFWVAEVIRTINNKLRIHIFDCEDILSTSTIVAYTWFVNCRSTVCPKKHSQLLFSIALSNRN